MNTNQRDQIPISLKDYVELIENNKRVTRRNTNGTSTGNQQQPPNSAPQQAQTGNNEKNGDKSSKMKKGSLQDEEPDLQKRRKISESDQQDGSYQGGVSSENSKNNIHSSSNWNPSSIYNDEVFEEIFSKFMDMERDPFLDIPELTSTLHGQFYLKDMNKIDAPYLVDSFAKVYSESQNLISIQNGFVQQASNKKKKRQLTIQSQKESKTHTQIVDCSKQDILILQNIAYLSMDQQSFLKHIRPNEKSQYQFNDFALPSVQQVIWPVVLFSCYGPIKDNARDFFTNDAYKIMDSGDIFKFGNYRKESIVCEESKGNDDQCTKGQSNGDKMISESQMNIESQSHINLPSQSQIPLQRSLSVQYQQNEVLIWFIGTNRYSIVNLSSLMKMEDMSRDFVKEIFKKTKLREILKTLVDLIKSHNQGVIKNKECTITIDNCKSMIHRIVKIRNTKQFKKKAPQVTSNDDFYYAVILRIKENRQKQTMQLLIKNLETSNLHWINLNQSERSIVTSLNIPSLGPQELRFNYFLDTQQKDSINPKEIALSFINRYLLRWFYEKSAINPLRDAEVDRVLQESIRDREIFAYENMPEKRRNKERCVNCKYILYNLEFKGCFYCGAYYHSQCIQSEDENPNKQFACENCEPCSICYGKITEDNIICCECKTHFHKKCGFSIAYDMNTNDKQIMRWYCESCVQCCICNNKLSDFQNGYSFKDDQIYCNDCIEQLQKKEYCPICKKFWSQETNKDMVQCTCSMWIHRNCDSLLKDDKLYDEYKNNQRSQYRCSNCRKRVRRVLMCQFIKVLSHLDFQKFFTKNEFEKIPNYLKLIKRPIDLYMMQRKAISGEYDNEPYEYLYKDFQLLISNALNFNAHHPEAYREATKLNLLGKTAFQYFQNLLKIDERELITMSEKTSIQGKQTDFIKYVEKNFLNIVFHSSLANKQLTTIELYNKQLERQQSNQNQMIDENTQKKEYENSVQYQEYLRDVQMMEENNIKQFKYTEVSNLVEQGDVIYNYLTFLQQMMNENNQIIVKFEEVDKIFEIFASRGKHESKQIQQILKNETLNKIVKGNPYLHDLMNNNTLDESNEQNQQDNAQSDNSSQEGGVSSGLISFHNALKQEIECFITKGKPFSFYECVPVKFTNQNIQLLKQSSCFMCGAFDGYKSLLFCTSCFESYHPYCLMITGRQEYFKEKMDRAMENRNWNCPKCQTCKVCNKGPNMTKNLYCRKCDAMVHFECEFKDIQVWSEAKNELYWQCSDCFSCGKCQSKQLLDDQDKQLVVNLDFTDNFSLCYKCGFLDAYYRFCKFCNKYCKKIPSLPKPANSQPLDDLFQEKSVRLKYLDQYLEEVLYQCKVCQQVYHKKCFEKAYPEHIQQFFCYMCKESNQSYMQKIYENSLVSTKCRIIHIRKVQEFLPIVELIIEKQALFFKLNRKDVGDFIAEYLHYFESDQFGIYKQNTTAYDKLCQQLRDEGIIITPANLKQMATYDEKAAIECLKQLENQKSIYRDVLLSTNVYTSSYDGLYSIAYFDSLRTGLSTPSVAEFANKYTFDKDGGFRQIQYNIFKLELKDNTKYDYRYNNNGQVEVLAMENDWKHPLQIIFEKQYEEVYKRLEVVLLRKRAQSNPSSSQAIQFQSRDGQNQSMEIEENNNTVSEQLIPLNLPQLPIKLNQSRYQTSLVYTAHLNQTLYNQQMKVYQEYYEYKKFFKYQTRIPILEEKEGVRINTVSGTNKRKDISQCIILLQAQEEQLVASIRQMLDEFMEKKKDKTKVTLTQQVLNSYQNFQKSILGSTNQIPMTYQEIINQFKEAQKTQTLVDNNIIEDPMREIPCQLCTLKGTRKMCGRLLNYDVDKWVHVNCALWSTEVKENVDGALKNFIPTYKKSLQVQCKYCNKFGATISCMIQSCKDKFHFPCLLKSNGFMTDQKTVLCKRCWDIILQNNDTEIIMKMQYLRLVNNFNTDRRIFISLTKQEGGNIDFSVECYNRFGSFILVNLDTKETNEDEFFSQFFFMRYIRPFVTQKIQSQVTVFWMKKKKDEYLLKSCLLAENHKIFTQCKTQEENKSEYFIDKDRSFTNELGSMIKNSAGYKEISDYNSHLPRYTNSVIQDQDVFNQDQLDSFTTLKGIQQLLQEKINQIFSGFKGIQPNKQIDVNKFVMEYIGFGIPQIVKACQQSSKQQKNNNIFQNIQTIKINSFQELFYKEQVESFNPFEKQKLLEKMHPIINQNQKQQQSQQMLGQQQNNIKDNQQSSHLNIPILQHLSHKQQGFGHFQKQSQKPTLGNNNFIRPDDIMQEANPDYMKQDTRQTIREKEIEKKIKAEYPNYINSKKRHLNVYAGPSKIHKYGLFAKTHFKQDDIVVEYLGETVRQVLADYREKIYTQRGFGDCYMFKAGPDKIIDATFKGNEARYLNHSCNPSCSSLVIEYERDSKIIIYAKRDIKPGEELTYDYCFDIEEEKITCNCNDPNCTGKMN